MADDGRKRSRVDLDDPIHRLKMCVGKQQFECKADALRFTNKPRAKSRKRMAPNAEIQAYRCPYCHKFHVGSSSKNRFRRFILKLGR